VLLEDRSSPHAAEGSLQLSDDLGIEVQFLPVATPELNAMDRLWRHVTADTLANRPMQSINETVDHVCQHIYAMSPQQRLK
jgi:hypothetical protein